MTGGQIYAEAERNASLLAVAREPRYINMAVRKKRGWGRIPDPSSISCRNAVRNQYDAGTKGAASRYSMLSLMLRATSS